MHRKPLPGTPAGWASLAYFVLGVPAILYVDSVTGAGAWALLSLLLVRWGVSWWWRRRSVAP